MKLSKLIFGLFVSFSALNANATLIVDQASAVGTDGQNRVGAVGSLNYRVFQSFTAGLNGTLDSIDVMIGTSGSPTEGLGLSIKAYNDPLGVALASTLLSPFSLNTPSFVNFDLSSFNLVMVSGTQYFIELFSAQNFQGNVNEYYIGGVGNGYAAGDLHHVSSATIFPASNTPIDLSFRTYVSTTAQPVSEPSMFWLFAMTMLAASRFIKRR